MLESVAGLLKFFPEGSVNQTRHHEWHSPCPFCNLNEMHREYNGVSFWGEDRFIWFINTKTFVCRFCKQLGKGRGASGLYTLTDVANHFGETVSETLEPVVTQREEMPLGRMWSESMVNLAHRKVDREWWYAYGWTDETIDRFRLGKGVFTSDTGQVHIIPMQLERVVLYNPTDTLGMRSDYYIAIRGYQKPLRSSGSVFNYWWRILGVAPRRRVYIAEGEKDAISLSQLVKDDIICSYGASSWTRQKTAVLRDQGYTEVISCGDNDVSGSMFNTQLEEDCQNLGLAHGYVNYSGLDKKVGYDITDLLVEYKSEAVRMLDNLLTISDVTASQGIAEYNPTLLTTIEDLRSETSPNSLYRIASEYIQKRGERDKDFLLINAPPGSGKSYSLVKLAMQVAQASLNDSIKERLALVAQVEEARARHNLAEDNAVLDYLEKSLQNFSHARIAWFGQYKDGFGDLQANGMSPDMCFNYEARNEDNCENFALVGILGAANHDIGKFCSLSCPFRNTCQVSGYLAQEEERKAYPITYFRHQHLIAPLANNYTKLVVIDENPSSVFDTPVYATQEDFLPHNPSWQTGLDSTQEELIRVLINTLRSMCAFNLGVKQRAGEEPPINYSVSGSKLLSLFESCLLQHTRQYTIDDMFNGVDVDVLETIVQPNYVTGKDVKKRVVATVFTALKREFPEWVVNPNNFLPTRIHLISGVFEVFPTPRARLRSTVPLIVADATAMPLLYQGAFRRPAVIHAPRVRNPNAEIIYLSGSDITKGQINKELGQSIRALKTASPEVRTLLDETVDLSQFISQDPTRFDSRIMRNVKALLDMLVGQYEQILLVTHKDLKGLLENQLKYPNVTFGHYGALRGSNAYANYPCAVLVGVYRVPYDVLWRKIQAWASILGLNEVIPAKTVVKELRYDGRDEVANYRTFDHWFGDLFVQMVEVGEAIQSAERIRPHSSNQKKTIYVMASRPTLRYVTQVIDKNLFLKDKDPSSKKNTILNSLLTILEDSEANTGIAQLPGNRELAKLFGVSYTTIGPLKKEALNKWGLRKQIERVEDE